MWEIRFQQTEGTVRGCVRDKGANVNYGSKYKSIGQGFQKWFTDFRGCLKINEQIKEKIKKKGKLEIFN